MSKECSKLGLGWVRPIVGFNNNHEEDNCDEIWEGLPLGENVVWLFGTPGQQDQPEPHQLVREETLAQAQGGAEMGG